MFVLHVAIFFHLVKDEEPLEDMEICDNGTSTGEKKWAWENISKADAWGLSPFCFLFYSSLAHT